MKDQNLDKKFQKESQQISLIRIPEKLSVNLAIGEKKREKLKMKPEKIT